MKSVRIPENFDGLRIVQISDLHLGSFPEGDKDLPRAFEMINALKPDAILLTGDILNDNSRDMRPWIKHLKSLEAPMGKYAVLPGIVLCAMRFPPSGRRESTVIRSRRYDIRSGSGKLGAGAVSGTRRYRKSPLRNTGRRFHDIDVA